MNMCAQLSNLYNEGMMSWCVYSWAAYIIKGWLLDESVSILDIFQSAVFSKRQGSASAAPPIFTQTLAVCDFLLYIELKFHLKVKIWGGGISVINSKGIFLKKMNVTFIVHIPFGKYSFHLNTFSTYIYTHTHTHTYV